MTVPLYLSAATVALSFFFPSSTSNTDKPSSTTNVTSGSTSTAKQSSLSIWRDARQAFTFGLVIGSGITIFMSSEIRKRRILERCRHAFLTWIYSDDDDNNEEDRLKCRKPKSIKNIDGISIGGGNGGVIGGSGAIKNGTNGSSSDGQHDDGDTATSTTSSGNGLRRILVSPSTAITSNLNVDILEIPQGKHLIHNISYGVECYYVIQGSGTYSYSNVHSNSLLDRAIDDGEDATDKNLEYAICEGEAFVVDHGSSREIKNNGRKPLTLLRATDNSMSMTNDGIQTTNNQSTVMSRMTNAILYHGKLGATKISQTLTSLSTSTQATSS